MSAPIGNYRRTKGNDVRPKQRSPLLRGLRCLEILQEQSATVAEIARSLEVNRSTAQRLLQELESAGYIQRDSDSRRYFAGSPQSIRGSGQVQEPVSEPSEGEWGEVLHQTLTIVRDLAGESTMFAVPARDQMLYAAFYPTDHPVSVQELVGSGRPMHASAVGKAYLSALGPATLDIVLGRLNYSDGTDKAAKGPFQLRDMLGEVYRQGFSVEHGETFEGLSCVATPVFVNGTILVGAAGITGPTHRFSDQRVKKYGELLVGRVRNLKSE